MLSLGCAIQINELPVLSGVIHRVDSDALIHPACAPQEHYKEERASLRISESFFQWLHCTHLSSAPQQPPMASCLFPHQGLPKPPSYWLLP